MAAIPDSSADIPEKKARLTPPNISNSGTSGHDGSAVNEAPSTSRGEQDDNVSEISDLSGLEEDMQESRWRPNHGPMAWVQMKMITGADPRVVLKELLPANMIIPDHVDDFTLWKIVLEIISEPPRRKKLKHVNTLDDAVNLIKSCKRIVVLTGAGISVSCGIPDFRSKDGIYAKLAVEYPDLSEPQDMFDISFFSKNPKPFFKFASEIYPGQFIPSISHKFIKHLDDGNKLLRNYTQNIDTLEQCAGIKNVIQCHGSFATASCMVCKYRVNSDDIKEDIMNQRIPKCPQCPADEERAVMKPDIVFFGEGLPEEFHKQMEMDKDQCDLLIVIGSSLKVRPVALIPNSIPAEVPQILINREPLRHMTFDVELLGNCDVITETLAQRLGWPELQGEKVLTEVTHDVLDELVNKERNELAAKLPMTINENTCDSVIQEIQGCHLCGSTDDCSHKPETEPAVAPVVTTEPVSHDMGLSSGATYSEPEHKSLAGYLPPGTFAFLPPNRYLFPGGEITNYDPSAESEEESSEENESGDDSPEEKPKHEVETESKSPETAQ